MFKSTANNDLLISSEHFSLSSHVTVGFRNFALSNFRSPHVHLVSQASSFPRLFKELKGEKEINYENERFCGIFCGMDEAGSNTKENNLHNYTICTVTSTIHYTSCCDVPKRQLICCHRICFLLCFFVVAQWQRNEHRRKITSIISIMNFKQPLEHQWRLCSFSLFGFILFS